MVKNKIAKELIFKRIDELKVQQDEYKAEKGWFDSEIDHQLNLLMTLAMDIMKKECEEAANEIKQITEQGA